MTFETSLLQQKPRILRKFREAVDSSRINVQVGLTLPTSPEEAFKLGVRIGMVKGFEKGLVEGYQTCIRSLERCLPEAQALSPVGGEDVCRH